ncbi:MAG: hypothetical protein SOY07_05465 [Bacteroidales bacterium]|nr:hypothetical protein [Bacteroidales bacterium]
MTTKAKSQVATLVVIVFFLAAVSLTTLGLANAALPIAMALIFAIETAKTFFLLKRFSAKNGKNTLVATVVAEAVSFALAAAIIAGLLALAPEYKFVHATAFCAAFIILRVASGLILSREV